MTAIGHPSAPGDHEPKQSLRAGLDACVHCGFCLQSCPTYLALEDENDSPRGRIVLMRSLLERELAPTDASARTHIDRCLGCRACETACPSGVPYGQLLEATREVLSAAAPQPLIARFILTVFARRRLLRLALLGARAMRALGVARVLSWFPGRIGSSFAMLSASTPTIRTRPYRAHGSGARGTVALLRGCVMDGLFAATNDATIRVLRMNDYGTAEATGQRCCGALHAHAGDLSTARALAKANVESFERSGADYVVANAAGCGAMMKEYGLLLADDPAWSPRAALLASKVRDVSELLAAAGPKTGGPVPLRVTYDAPCHLVHAQRLSTTAKAVLAAVPELDLIPLIDEDQCCGAAGIYNLTQPDVSEMVLAPKVRNIVETGAELVATGNPGCAMQIGAALLKNGSRCRVVHPVELLDASYAASTPA